MKHYDDCSSLDDTTAMKTLLEHFNHLLTQFLYLELSLVPGALVFYGVTGRVRDTRRLLGGVPTRFARPRRTSKRLERVCQELNLWNRQSLKRFRFFIITTYGSFRLEDEAITDIRFVISSIRDLNSENLAIVCLFWNVFPLKLKIRKIVNLHAPVVLDSAKFTLKLLGFFAKTNDLHTLSLPSSPNYFESR